MMLPLAITTTLLLQGTKAAANFLCSSTGDKNGTALMGNVCRNATTPCEEAAVCDGASLACPEYKFKPNTTVARAAATLCDVVEMCSGYDSSVPTDTFKAAGFVIHPLTSACDVEDVCSGVDAVVPNDTFQPAGFVIHPSTSVCDIEDVCSGVDAVVPNDTYQPAGTVFRASTSTDGCDPAEVCTGVDASLPPDVDNCVRVAIEVLGKSGKFSVFDESVGEADPNKVTVEIDALRELDDAGDEVGKSEPVKHSIKSFASQDFIIHPAVNATYGNVSATMVAFDTPISSIGNLSVDTYILKSSGTVGTDTETWAVRANDIKFNIVLSDWKWCGEASNCKNRDKIENGTYIDVDIKIKGKAEKPQNRTGKGGKGYDLGGDVGLDLSDRVLVDGVWAVMPEGFPKMELKGSSAIFRFRFPKFTQNATYDPVVEFAASLPDKPLEVVTPSPTPTTSTTTTTGFTTTTPLPSGGSSRLLQNEAETASTRRARRGAQSRSQSFLAASMLEIMQKSRKERKHTEF